MKEAILYRKLLDKSIICNVCRNTCLVKNGEFGLCKVRKNIDGVFYAMNYGLTVGRAIDPIEKKPLYGFLPKTQVYSFAASGCNFNCLWCQNHDIAKDIDMNSEPRGLEISPEIHIKSALRYNCPSIAYTYTEPTVFIEYALDTMKLAREANLKNIWVSNGYMTREALALIIPYLDAANIDLKAHDTFTYGRFCRGSLDPVVENLKLLQNANVHIEISTLVIPNVNDDKNALEKIADIIVSNLGCDVIWHVARFFPDYIMSDAKITPLDTLLLAKDIGIKRGIKNVFIGNI